MKHTLEELKQMQSLPLEAKIIMSKRRIKAWYDYWEGLVYVSWSGGKDSTVLKHLVATTVGVYGVPNVFVNTGLEYPEIQQFVRQCKTNGDNVEIVRPKMGFKEVIEKYGYPVVSKEVAHGVRYARKPGTKSGDYFLAKFNGEVITKNGEKSGFNMEKWNFLIDAPFKISSECCDVMKKKPIKKYAKETGRKPIIGTMASESRLRLEKWIQNGCNGFTMKSPVSNPLSFWTEQDILHYIKKFNIPYASVYGQIVPKGGQMSMFGEEYEELVTTGCNRTGCMFCMFGCHLEDHPNRFERMRETHPKQYDYCMKVLGLNKVLDFINVKY